jgi:hypothetical protein
MFVTMGRGSCQKPLLAAALLLGGAVCLHAQAIQINSVDPKLTPQRLHPTSIQLSDQKLDSKTRGELLRIMEAEEAFTMRALPLGHKGITLRANGGVTPDGSDYLTMIKQNGVSAKPGARVHVSNIRIEGDKVILDLNGGPDKKHHWLQHISVGNDRMGQLAPSEDDPVGARVTLLFPKYVPEMTGQQMKALLSPLLDFSLKSPLEAYTDTLPPLLRDAVKDHKVLVGMDRDMVLYALGEPDRKLHEDGPDGWNYEEWIYGRPPADVKFVRFAGDRVTRMEIAGTGKELIIRDQDETNGYQAKKKPENEKIINEGDAAPNQQQAPPTLRRPGETGPQDQPQPVKAPGSDQIASQLMASVR